jgi:hypothetical protein
MPAPSRMRLAFATVAIGLLALGGAGLSADTDPTIRLTWAVVYRGTDGITKAIDYRLRVVQLACGDRIRILMRPASPCFCYVMLHDAQKDLVVLFPEISRFPSTPLPADATRSLPDGERWYRLDEDGGTEVFYLIVADHRLKALEASVAAYGALKQNSGGDRGGVRKQAVLDEIRKLVVETSPLAEAARKPLAVAGDFRGIDAEAGFPGISVLARNVYVKTIRLQH